MSPGCFFNHCSKTLGLVLVVNLGRKTEDVKRQSSQPGTVVIQEKGQSDYTMLTIWIRVVVFFSSLDSPPNHGVIQGVRGGVQGAPEKNSQMCDTIFRKQKGKTSSNTKFQHLKIIFLVGPAILLFFPPFSAFLTILG